MKNLFERLSEKNKKKLKDFKLQYSALGSNLISTLEQEMAWVNLKIYDAGIILQETSEKELSVNNLNDLFNGN
ncbi:hypothetical protein [Flavobacterium sp.]|jgi:hypothetical protein|uniref:hypothetical protein n=1 Tax=Flavobacterium sp. TaxID=239 RepID=UPI0037BF7A14